MTYCALKLAYQRSHLFSNTLVINVDITWMRKFTCTSYQSHLSECYLTHPKTSDHPLHSPPTSINMFASKDYQTKIAATIRKEVKATGRNLLIGAVGLITEAEQAKKVVQDSSFQRNGGEVDIEKEADVAKEMTDATTGEPMADVILVARQFMREPEWVLRVAWKLGVDVAWPSQFNRVRFPKL